MSNMDVIISRKEGISLKQRILEAGGCTRLLHRNVIIALTLLFIVIGLTAHTSEAKASTVQEPNKVNVIVDYLEETATVTPGSNGSTKFYVSTDKKNWESLGSNVLDISTFLKPKETVLYFKGNKDTAVRDVKFAAEDTSLKAVYQVVDGVGRVTLSGTPLPVEFRKGANGQWKPISSVTPSAIITTAYETYGATLYFRTTGAVDRRPGKIVAVKIPKRPSAPSVKVDGSKLHITGLKPGETQYRVGDSLEWKLFPANSAVKTIDLKELLGPTLPVNTPLPAGIIEFRSIHNDSKKKVASAIKVIEVAAQPVAPTNVTLNGTTLTVADSNQKKGYEYTTVIGSGTLDMKKAKWNALTPGKSVVVKNVGLGDKILVRAKTYTDSSTKILVPASLYTELTVTAITPGRK